MGDIAKSLIFTQNRSMGLKSLHQIEWLISISLFH